MSLTPELINGDAITRRVPRIVKPPETKREKFERISKGRVDQVIKAIDVLANLGRNQSAYEYSEADVEHIDNRLMHEMEQLRTTLLPRARKPPAPFSWE